MNSCISLTDVPGVLAVILDSSGYISSIFNVPSGFPSDAQTIAAWNGASSLWVYEYKYSTLYVFSLSGTLLSSTSLSFAAVGPTAMSIAPDGTMVWRNGSGLERRNTSGAVTATLSFIFCNALCVDSGNNTVLDNGSTIRKYNSAFSLQWTTSITGSVYAIVVTSGNSIYAAYEDSSTGGRNLSLLNSSGTIQWTQSLPFDSSNGAFVDLWCDGTNAYLAYTKNAQPWRTKYNSSGTQQFDEPLCWNQGNTDVRTIRGNGSMFSVAGRRP